MTAHIKPIRVAVTPEFPDGIGYEVSRILPNWASAQAGASALEAVNPVAFSPRPPGASREYRLVLNGSAPYTPGLCAGEAVDAPEGPWPSDATARVYPPNCDGAGEALAQAQHEAAIDGDECTSGACLLTRGSD